MISAAATSEQVSTCMTTALGAQSRLVRPRYQGKICRRSLPPSWAGSWSTVFWHDSMTLAFSMRSCGSVAANTCACGHCPCLHRPCNPMPPASGATWTRQNKPCITLELTQRQTYQYTNIDSTGRANHTKSNTDTRNLSKRRNDPTQSQTQAVTIQRTNHACTQGSARWGRGLLLLKCLYARQDFRWPPAARGIVTSDPGWSCGGRKGLKESRQWYPCTPVERPWSACMYKCSHNRVLHGEGGTGPAAPRNQSNAQPSREQPQEVV